MQLTKELVAGYDSIEWQVPDIANFVFCTWSSFPDVLLEVNQFLFLVEYLGVSQKITRCNPKLIDLFILLFLLLLQLY